VVILTVLDVILVHHRDLTLRRILLPLRSVSNNNACNKL
jgi:hypothetical protein